MGQFLAERYLPTATPEALASQVDHDRAAVRAMSIRYIQTPMALRSRNSGPEESGKPRHSQSVKGPCGDRSRK